MSANARTIDWVYLDPTDAAAATPGCLVSAEPGGMPIYKVISIADGVAGLRNLMDGTSRHSPLTAFRWKALSPQI